MNKKHTEVTMRYTFYVTIVTKLLSVKASISLKNFLFVLSHVQLFSHVTV